MSLVSSGPKQSFFPVIYSTFFIIKKIPYKTCHFTSPDSHFCLSFLTFQDLVMALIAYCSMSSQCFQIYFPTSERSDSSDKLCWNPHFQTSWEMFLCNLSVAKSFYFQAKVQQEHFQSISLIQAFPGFHDEGCYFLNYSITLAGCFFFFLQRQGGPWPWLYVVIWSDVHF